MSGQMFMRVAEVAKALGVSEPYAYKLIRALNEELKKTGCITMAGRIDRKFFYEKFYGTKNQNKGKKIDGSVQKQGKWHMVCAVPLH